MKNFVVILYLITFGCNRLFFNRFEQLSPHAHLFTPAFGSQLIHLVQHSNRHTHLHYSCTQITLISLNQNLHVQDRNLFFSFSGHLLSMQLHFFWQGTHTRTRAQTLTDTHTNTRACGTSTIFFWFFCFTFNFPVHIHSHLHIRLFQHEDTPTYTRHTYVRIFNQRIHLFWASRHLLSISVILVSCKSNPTEITWLTPD